jgi:internalin A
MTETEVNNIYLNNNKIQLLDISWFDKLGKLDISNNDIRFISDLKLPLTIRHLNLSNNKITNLNGLEKYTKLKTLDISFNNIEESAIVVKWLNNLKYINIEWNKVSTWTLSKLNEFNSVYLSNNKKPFSE